MLNRYYFGLAVLIAQLLCRPAFLKAQDTGDTQDMLAQRMVWSGSIQYQNIPGVWDITYFGVTAEFFHFKSVSLSGPIYFGKGSDNVSYLHFPAAGLFMMLPLVVLEWIVPGIGDAIVKDSIPSTFSAVASVLLLENLRFNIRVGEKVRIFPYLNLLGAELSGSGEEGGGVTLNTGAGLRAARIIKEQWLLSFDVSYRRFFVWEESNFGKGSYNGYALSLSFGYIF